MLNKKKLPSRPESLRGALSEKDSNGVEILLRKSENLNVVEPRRAKLVNLAILAASKHWRTLERRCHHAARSDRIQRESTRNSNSNKAGDSAKSTEEKSQYMFDDYWSVSC